MPPRWARRRWRARMGDIMARRGALSTACGAWDVSSRPRTCERPRRQTPASGAAERVMYLALEKGLSFQRRRSGMCWKPY